MTADPGPISVVIPAYNAAGFLADTLRAALGQTRPPDEVIVVDDASPDGTAAAAEALGPPVRVVRRAANGGASAARNDGVAAARGEWIAFLDADDLWAPDRLERLAPLAAAAGPDVVALFNDCEWVRPDGRREPRPTPVEGLGDDYAVELLRRWLVNPSCFLVRAAAARAVPFPVGVRHGEDQQFTILLRRLGRLQHVPEALTGYRQRAGQLTARPDHGLIGVRANWKFVDDHPDLYPPGRRDDALRALAGHLELIHESAFWRRDYGVVRECRRLYPLVSPDAAPPPPLFRARLRPRWLARAKDWLDRRAGRGGAQ